MTLVKKTEKNKNISRKYDNAFRVSVPNWMIDEMIVWAGRKQISIQDFNRRALEFYINHLNHDQQHGENKRNASSRKSEDASSLR
jgi:hypothetical protein